MAHFDRWCRKNNYQSFPAAPEVVAEYITALAHGHADDADDGSGTPRKPSTIRRRLATIARLHALAKIESPTDDARVRRVWRGLRKEFAAAPNQKEALLLEQVHACADAQPDTLRGTRDRALLLFGYETAARRCEITGVDVEHMRFHAGGVVLTFPRSKTNQEGKLEQIAVPRSADAAHCPIRALEAWLAAADIHGGAVFRRMPRDRLVDARMTGADLALVVKAAVSLVSGLDPSGYAGHSLRAGWITTQARAGRGNRYIKRRSRHESSEMVDRYVRHGELLAEVQHAPEPTTAASAPPRAAGASDEEDA